MSLKVQWKETCMALIRIPYHDGQLDISILTANSRCVDVTVHDDLSIDMKVPLGMNSDMIEHYVKRNQETIIREYEQVRKRNHQALQATLELHEGIVQYRNGLHLPYLGDMKLALRIVHIPDLEDTRIYDEKTVDGGRILTIKTDTDDQDFLRYCVMRYYKRCAARLIRKKAAEFAQKMSLAYREIQIIGLMRGTSPRFPKMSYQNIEIKNQATLWGSCSRRKNLKFDWKLIMLPMEVIDYVIVHELGHLKKMNHSKAFWREVEHVMPEYKECRSWLSKHGKEYEIF